MQDGTAIALPFGLDMISSISNIFHNYQMVICSSNLGLYMNSPYFLQMRSNLGPLLQIFPKAKRKKEKKSGIGKSCMDCPFGGNVQPCCYLFGERALIILINRVLFSHEFICPCTLGQTCLSVVSQTSFIIFHNKMCLNTFASRALLLRFWWNLSK